jgi:hypothetical protein
VFRKAEKRRSGLAETGVGASVDSPDQQGRCHFEWKARRAPNAAQTQQGVTSVTDRCSRTTHDERAIMIAVTRVRAALLLSIVLMWVASSAVACVLPCATLTPAERGCCHHMAEQFGQAAMPASHACCQTKSHRPDALPQASASVPKRDLTCAVAAIQTTFVIPVASPASLAVYLHSPPHHADSSSISILRI